jgi:hypothetical protein
MAINGGRRHLSENGAQMASICIKSNERNGDLWTGVSLKNSLAMNELNRIVVDGIECHDISLRRPIASHLITSDW